MPVLGIGGLFFRARDPDALAAWYREHLNVGAGCAPDATEASSPWTWDAQGGPTVFAPFKADTDYLPEGKQWMLNLRVGDLDALLEGLRSAGIEAITKPEWDDPQTGRFARIHDPEGNAVELWQPPA